MAHRDTCEKEDCNADKPRIPKQMWELAPSESEVVVCLIVIFFIIAVCVVYAKLAYRPRSEYAQYEYISSASIMREAAPSISSEDLTEFCVSTVSETSLQDRSVEDKPVGHVSQDIQDGDEIEYLPSVGNEEQISPQMKKVNKTKFLKTKLEEKVRPATNKLKNLKRILAARRPKSTGMTSRRKYRGFFDSPKYLESICQLADQSPGFRSPPPLMARVMARGFHSIDSLQCEDPQEPHFANSELPIIPEDSELPQTKRNRFLNIFRSFRKKKKITPTEPITEDALESQQIEFHPPTADSTAEVEPDLPSDVPKKPTLPKDELLIITPETPKFQIPAVEYTHFIREKLSRGRKKRRKRYLQKLQNFEKPFDINLRRAVARKLNIPIRFVTTRHMSELQRRRQLRRAQMERRYGSPENWALQIQDLEEYPEA